MKRILAALMALVVLVALAPTSAIAGSNNGTRNWYWLKSCRLSNGVTNLVVTNYDKITTGWTKQEYHIDADKGTTRVAWITVNFDGKPTFQWNDFYLPRGDFAAHTLELSTNLGKCRIRG